MTPADVDVDVPLVKLDGLPLDIVEQLNPTAFAAIVTHILNGVEHGDDDMVAPFQSYI